ncbi:ATP-binding protein [Nocardiopsis dassonvillei]|uniref:ATP-binding protein n=1 Tax=Nocardiopsis dassonvillei TaxID=2014 RepID=UPI00157DE424|nr:ATP-binding protein [Nocardiopsis dassonvillei]
MSNIELIRAARAAFPHITPLIPDFESIDDRGGDSFTAIRDTARIITATANLIPVHYQHADATDEQVLAWIGRLVEASGVNRVTGVPHLKSGGSLLLIGPTGTGKTFQGYGALRRLSILGIACSPVASSITDIYAKMRPRPGVDSESVFESYANARLLMVDDLGAAKTSEWVEEVNYRLVNHRYENHLPTLFTSNVPPKELGERLGERVASRLIEMTQTVVLKGSDRRRGRAA